MLSNEITAIVGAHPKRKRVGRGKGTGHGKTCGRGHKGYGSRAGASTHLANAGVPVTLLDIVPGDSPDMNKIVKEGWDRCLKARPANLMSNDLKTLVTLGNLEDDFGAVAEADWICEAIIENLELKKELFKQLDEICPSHALLTSNTSSMTITEMAAATNRMDKVAGLHFFNPVPVMRLVEIVRTIVTSDETVQTLKEFSESLGKTVVMALACPAASTSSL